MCEKYELQKPLEWTSSMAPICSIWKPFKDFGHLSLLGLKILWRSAQVTDGVLVDGQNFDFKEFFLDTGHLSSIQKMKIFERLLDKFLIFAQFIQIDAIVGGYEASPHRNALRNHFVTYILSRNFISPPPPRASNFQSECLKSILKSATYSFTKFGLSLLCWIFDKWKLGHLKCKLLQRSGWN